jgi:hypothetical protein
MTGPQERELEAIREIAKILGIKEPFHSIEVRWSARERLDVRLGMYPDFDSIDAEDEPESEE